MRKGINGLNPVVALILTVLAAALTVLLFCRGHVFWGVVCTLITLDFGADALLSCKNA